MSPNVFPYIPDHIVLRRYEEINIYDLKNDESYIIDEEAYSLLKLIDCINSKEKVLAEFSDDKRQEASEAMDNFYELRVINFRSNKAKAISSFRNDQIPEENPFSIPHLKNLMINITEKCNLTCKHCYITNKNLIDFPLEELKKIILEFYDLQGSKLVLTGGEPLLYSNLKELLTFLKQVPLIKIILTNGILFKEKKDIINLLKDNYFEVFVSIDGLEDTHNDFRDANCFQDSIEGIKLLLKENIKVSINTMVHKQNFNEFDDLLKLIQGLGPISNWSIDIPTWDDSIPQDIREKYEISDDEGGQILKDYGWGEFYGSPSYNFTCGPNIMAIDVLGIVTKCGFFYNENVGNIFELGLRKSWELIQEKQNWEITDLNCCRLNCEFLEACRGGCRYRAYKTTGDIFGIDSFKCSQFGRLNE